MSKPIILGFSTAIIKYHRLGGLNNRNLFFHSSAGCEVQDQGAADSVPGVSSHAGLQMAAFSRCPHMVETASTGVICLSYKGTCPFGSGPHSYDLIEPLSPPHRPYL